MNIKLRLLINCTSIVNNDRHKQIFLGSCFKGRIKGFFSLLKIIRFDQTFSLDKKMNKSLRKNASTLIF